MFPGRCRLYRSRPGTFPTASKGDAGPVVGLDFLKQVVKKTPLPVIAIGGINRENASLVMQTGVHGIAVISAALVVVIKTQRGQPDVFDRSWRKRINRPDRVSDIGEFGLIRRIHDLLKKEGIQSDRVTLGIGDDAASFLPRPGYELLVTCDCIVEGRHFLSGKISFLNLGRRAMALNISDIGAMEDSSMP